jgi:hypothetical protein
MYRAKACLSMGRSATARTVAMLLSVERPLPAGRRFTNGAANDLRHDRNIIKWTDLDLRRVDVTQRGCYENG